MEVVSTGLATPLALDVICFETPDSLEVMSQAKSVQTPPSDGFFQGLARVCYELLPAPHR